MGFLLFVITVSVILSFNSLEAKEPIGENKWFNGPALVKTAKATLDFHKNVGKGNFSKTLADGKEAYAKKKKIDKLLERREDDPLKDIQDVFQVGKRLATKKPQLDES